MNKQDVEVLKMVYAQAVRDFNACTNHKMVPLLERMIKKAATELQSALSKGN